MAQNKNKDTKKKGSRAVKSPEELSSGKNTRSKKRPVEKKTPSVFLQILPYILAVLALFIVICLISGAVTGVVGRAIRMVLFGLFGGTSVAVPVLMGITAFFMIKENEQSALKSKLIFGGLFQLFLCIFVHLITFGTDVSGATYNVKELWIAGTSWENGGVIGGLIGNLMLSGIGPAGSYIVSVMGILLFGMFLFGLTPKTIWVYIAYNIRKKREERAKMSAHVGKRKQMITEEAYLYDEDDPEISENIKRRDRESKKELFEADVEIDEDGDVIIEPSDTAGSVVDEAVFDAVFKKQEENAEKGIYDGAYSETVVSDVNSPLDLNGIFTDPSGDEKELSGDFEDGEAELELTVERRKLIQEEKKKKEEAKPIYNFPPITLLHMEANKNNEDISDELHSNAVKLVETLKSFKVRTKIVNVSRGPTITRYELSPEEGIRVRSITNLVDDIALNLATSGVRIEAPIPGKQAVGIEVPNRNISTVYLRELIDDTRFKQSQSKLSASLGVDVAGEPVYLDIAKMPHLLIAGATGSGKSVCINSMIMSLLYKGTPDEVKLILIDPKKVELSIYNGLPHLLVPVVSEPKKAAGALSWAVTEMERRFELIEQCGVRNIKNYNLVTKDDPDREFMPQLVIIIDELADLMMTAPDDVENSICRLAQKGRAAGIHLIVGTQRPSVDVVTGLIKANIPSRIAFAVSSITDSRVILDYSGAEKLIGRGDMLFAPIGALKPIRVQGAFVSENEVEAVVEFIKSHAEEDREYDLDVLNTIEREAAKCGQKGSKGSGSFAADGSEGDGEQDGDAMLRPAIELAVESGKISTSLIQRRLSLGYGRAAKLIDKMEQMGIVSAPDGQKPRSVLITKQDYMEMVLKKDDLGEE